MLTFPLKFRGWHLHRAQTGLTLIELLIVIAVGSLLILTLTLLVGRSFQISREQFEQVRITEDARLQLDRLSDTLRNSQFIDCDGDGATDADNEHWLRQAEANLLEVYSNVDSDSEKELVRFEVSSSDSTHLLRTVTQPAGSGAGDRCDFSEVGPQQTVMQTLRNVEQSPPVPLFRYYQVVNGEETELTSLPITPGDADHDKVNQVRLALYVDVGEQQFPSAAEIITDVTFRSVECPSGDCGLSACVDPGLQSVGYAYSGDFADQAFTACTNSCGNQADGTCCGWSVGFDWDGDTNGNVTALCQCGGAFLPTLDGNNDVETTNITTGNYSATVRACLDGTTCSGERGDPHCDPGCLGLGETGSCVCECPN